MKDYALPEHKVTVKRKLHWEVFWALLVLVLGLLAGTSMLALSESNKRAALLEYQLRAEQSAYGIKMIDVGDGFLCSPPRGVRREWELVVKQKCKELAQTLWAGRGQP